MPDAIHEPFISSTNTYYNNACKTKAYHQEEKIIYASNTTPTITATHTMSHIPMAKCMGTVTPTKQEQRYSKSSLPVANYVGTIHEKPHSVRSSHGSSSWMSSTSIAPFEESQVPQAEAIPVFDEEEPTETSTCLSTPDNSSRNFEDVSSQSQSLSQPSMAARSLVTDANSHVNDSHQSNNNNNNNSHKHCNLFVAGRSITGNELLGRLKHHRIQATRRSALIGSVVGFLVGGPIGAIGIGVGSACVTKRRLKRKEKALAQQLQGRLDQPLPVLTSSAPFSHEQSQPHPQEA